MTDAQKKLLFISRIGTDSALLLGSYAWLHNMNSWPWFAMVLVFGFIAIAILLNIYLTFRYPAAASENKFTLSLQMGICILAVISWILQKAAFGIVPDRTGTLIAVVAAALFGVDLWMVLKKQV